MRLCSWGDQKSFYGTSIVQDEADRTCYWNLL